MSKFTKEREQQLKKQTISAMKSSLCVVQQACDKVGIARATYYKWMKQDADFRSAIEDLSEISIDYAESQLFKHMQKHYMPCMYYLNSKARHRGYQSQVDHQHTVKGDVVIEVKSEKVKKKIEQISKKKKS